MHRELNMLKNDKSKIRIFPSIAAMAAAMLCALVSLTAAQDAERPLEGPDPSALAREVIETHPSIAGALGSIDSINEVQSIELIGPPAPARIRPAAQSAFRFKVKSSTGEAEVWVRLAIPAGKTNWEANGWRCNGEFFYFSNEGRLSNFFSADLDVLQFAATSPEILAITGDVRQIKIVGGGATAHWFLGIKTRSSNSFRLEISGAKGTVEASCEYKFKGRQNVFDSRQWKSVVAINDAPSTSSSALATP